MLKNHPNLLIEPYPSTAALYLGIFSRAGDEYGVKMLLDNGVDVNVLVSTNGRALDNCSRHTSIIKLLIEHGAEVNYLSDPNFPKYCVSIATCIHTDNIFGVKLLVEAGAYLDVCDLTNRTPLQWAIDYGRTEIAYYLRSKGAIEAHLAKNYIPRSPATEVTTYIEDRLSTVISLGWQPIVPGNQFVEVHALMHERFGGIFTDGMSKREIPVPTGDERYRFAELAMPLDAYWPEEISEWHQDQYIWPIQWLHKLANYPFLNNRWLGNPFCIIPNGDPPQPLSVYTKMTCWLLLVDKSPLKGIKRADGSELVFYTVYPLHTAESEFARIHGLPALLGKFAECKVSEYGDFRRESVI
ncbi:MAG: suppressor of fused domain protein [Zavarzinella sp.]